MEPEKPNILRAAAPAAQLVSPDPSLDPLAGKIGGPDSKKAATPVAATALPAVMIALLVVLLALVVLAYAFLG